MRPDLRCGPQRVRLSIWQRRDSSAAASSTRPRMGRRRSGASTIARRRRALLTSLLLDTSVLIDVERDGFDLDEVIGDDDEPAIAAITVAELGVGVEIASGKRRSVRKLLFDEHRHAPNHRLRHRCSASAHGTSRRRQQAWYAARRSRPDHCRNRPSDLPHGRHVRPHRLRRPSWSQQSPAGLIPSNPGRNAAMGGLQHVHDATTRPTIAREWRNGPAWPTGQMRRRSSASSSMHPTGTAPPIAWSSRRDVRDHGSPKLACAVTTM